MNADKCAAPSGIDRAMQAIAEAQNAMHASMAKQAGRQWVELTLEQIAAMDDTALWALSHRKECGVRHG